MKKTIWVLLLLVPSVAAAQTSQDSWNNLNQLRVGQKIEVVDMKLKSVKGMFVSFSEEAISLRADDGEKAIEHANVLRVSVLRGRSRKAGIGALIGLGAGAAGVVAAFKSDTEVPQFSFLSLPIFSGIGAAAGAAMPPGYRTIYRAQRRELASGR